jgi:hypothetical protein
VHSKTNHVFSPIKRAATIKSHSDAIVNWPMASTTLTVPARMSRVSRRFERWRSAHTGRLPIPDDLWASAAEVAKEHGVSRTAKILRLEYGKLKRLVQSAADVSRTTAPPALWS